MSVAQAETTPLDENVGNVRRVLATPAALQPWIAGIGVLTITDQVRADVDRVPRSFAQAPDTSTKLVLHVEDGGRRDALIVGPRTRATYHAGKRSTSCVQFDLRPGSSRRLLGVAATELVGRVVPLDGLPGADALTELSGGLLRLEPESMVAHLEQELPGRLGSASDAERADLELLRAAVDAMSTGADHRPEPVHRSAHRLAVSERRLRTMFADGVGLSPKHFARIDRVRHILADASRTPLAQLAATTGYYDQSHMTADFRAVMGVPPTSFFTGRLPAARPCQGWRRA